MYVSLGSTVDLMGNLTQQSAFVRKDFALGSDWDALHNDYCEDYLQCNICRHHNPMSFCCFEKEREISKINIIQILLQVIQKYLPIFNCCNGSVRVVSFFRFVISIIITIVYRFSIKTKFEGDY